MRRLFAIQMEEVLAGFGSRGGDPSPSPFDHSYTSTAGRLGHGQGGGSGSLGRSPTKSEDGDGEEEEESQEEEEWQPSPPPQSSRPLLSPQTLAVIQQYRSALSVTSRELQLARDVKQDYRTFATRCSRDQVGAVWPFLGPAPI